MNLSTEKNLPSTVLRPVPQRTVGTVRQFLKDGGLSPDQRRALLASWASDVRAVEGAPGLRRLDNGEIVEIDEILSALTALDPQPRSSHAAPRGTRWRPRHRRRKLVRRAQPYDDNPPDRPAGAAVVARPGRLVMIASNANGRTTWHTSCGG
jgi:hypothetical protein